MGFLIAVTAAGTACLESFGWKSVDHIEIDAKAWPGIVAMELGMACDIRWGETKEETRCGHREGSGTLAVLEGQQNVLSYNPFASLTSAPTASLPFFSSWSTWYQQRDAEKRFVDPNNRKVTREIWLSRALHLAVDHTRRLSDSIKDPTIKL